MQVLLVQGLLQHYEALRVANTRFADAVRADQDLPLLLPGHSNAGVHGRDLAIQSMTQMWLLEPGEVLPKAGVVCASPATIRQAENLNQAKDDFRQAIKAVREAVTGNKSRLDKLIDRVLQQQDEAQRRRIDSLQLALKRAKINRLDLLRCYANIRILPEQLMSISWTWARTHSAIDKISREDAIEQAENLSNSNAREIALSRLQALSPEQSLVFKKKLPNQLRANLLYRQSDEVKRKAITISGIVLCQDPILPERWVWRDDPGEADKKAPPRRITRLDSKIDPEPYIKALHLHRYLGDLNGQ
ncbi:hypothetical protein DC094_19615 [Pelagibaculum spongiae]|uniref:DNA replication terminus site-binding protein n=2 Tax=Pelagibaculum spongiae TaxID=2080658 RepID=A0A2V1GVV0_9GAMM|nr:hypothetical protein DC094_19615 [Pelagibaculum spongiae]